MIALIAGSWWHLFWFPAFFIVGLAALSIGDMLNYVSNKMDDEEKK